MNEEIKKKRIWAIAGGKGGIGKSFVAANLGIALAERGKKVVVVDADLGGANLHTFLGLPNPPKTLNEFLKGEVKNLKKILMDTGIPNYLFIPGLRDDLTIINPNERIKQKLIHHIRTLDADHVIVDLGTGISPTIFDLFLISDNGIILVTPETTSLENAYRFIKGVFYHRWLKMVNNKRVKSLISLVMQGSKPEGISSPTDLIAKIESEDAHTAKLLREGSSAFRPRLIVNQARNRTEAELGFAIRSVCRKYFGLELIFLGYILYDHNVYLSIKQGRPFFFSYPSSDVVNCIRSIAVHISEERGLEWSLP